MGSHNLLIETGDSSTSQSDDSGSITGIAVGIVAALEVIIIIITVILVI